MNRLAAACVGLGLVALGCEGRIESSIGTSRSALQRTHDCNELLALLKEDARAKMNARIDAQIQVIRATGAFYGGAKDAGAGETSAPTSPSADAARDYSETTTQVAGVDEADVVKTDGAHIFLLHGQELLVLDAWPAASLATVGSAEIEGEPSEMFVAGGKAIVFSTVDGDPIYTASGVPVREPYGDAVYATPAVGAPAPGFGWSPHPLTKITVLDVTSSSQPTVQRELYFEGTYVSSRRTGSRVRAVLSGGAHGPSLLYAPDASTGAYPTTADAWVEAMEALRRKDAAAIDASTIADWIPFAMVRRGAEVTAQPVACSDFYVPTTESTAFGLTQIASLDLESPAAPPTEVAVVGAVDTIYQNPDTMILAARAWGDPYLALTASAGGAGSGGGAVPAQSPATLDFTHLHRFDLVADPTTPTYVASGTVPGQVDDQFSIDERAGELRVATTEQRVSSGRTSSTVNHLFVLGARGDALEVVGDAGDLAPGERVYSARFVGDRGYLVTFRQVDPLFVLDLSDATNPRVIGEVTIPGFSTYMHPLDEGHLLTIGQDATPEGRVLGLALQIFDVTNGASPRLADKLVFSGQDYGYSEALYDHKAFTYFASRGLLAFPFVAYGSSSMRSSCEVFHVTVADGITKLGSVDHTSLFAASPQGYCGGYFGPYVRRGVFLESVLFSISYGGVVATDVADLSHPLAVLPLPAPSDNAVPKCAE